MFFRNFPSIQYRFGNQENITNFQDLSLYVEIIDQIKDDVTYYNTYEIQDGERPDQLSQKLYRSQRYYWTFYLLNDNIRQHGWPLENSEIIEYVKQTHPNVTIRTTEDISSSFTVGQSITGITSLAAGVIIRKDLALGQIVVKLNENSNNFISGETIRTFDVEGNSQLLVARSVVDEYLSTSYYIDQDNNQVDIDPFTLTVPAIYTPKTYLDLYQQQNDNLREIKIIKKSLVQQVESKFQSPVR